MLEFLGQLCCSKGVNSEASMMYMGNSDLLRAHHVQECITAYPLVLKVTKMQNVYG